MSDKKKKSRKPAFTCHINQWVGKEDPALADAIRDLCLESRLIPRKMGLTFLFPEKKVREKITDLAYSVEKEDVDLAIKMLIAHILFGVKETGADFGSAVGNALRVKLEVEKADGDTVKLANGAELKKAKSYRPLRDRTAVWEVKGEIPMEGEVFEMVRRGGAEPATNGRAAVANFAQRVEKSYADNLARGGGAVDNEYLRAVVSFTNWLSVNDPDTLCKIYPLYDLNPIVTFYLIFEPYKRQGSYLVDAQSITSWGFTNLYENAAQEWLDLFDKREEFIFRLYGDSIPWSVKAPEKVFGEVDRVRQKLSNSLNASTPTAVREFYKKAIADNAVGGLTPIFPESTRAALMQNCMKLWQDEFRFTVHLLFANDLNEALQHVRLYYTGDDYEKELQMSDGFRGVRPQDTSDLLFQWINSTSFFYVPCSQVRGGATEVDLVEFYNPEPSKRAYLKSLRIPRASLISGDLATRSKLYERRYGKKPDL